MKKALLIDENKLEELENSLTQEEYIVEYILEEKEIMKKAIEENYKVILIRVDSKNIDGIEICSKLRNITESPIITIASKENYYDKILSLEQGADDYLVEPIDMIELKARLNSVISRIGFKKDYARSDNIKIDNFKINFISRAVTLLGQEIELTSKEFDIFFLLIINKGKIFSREEIFYKIWGDSYYGDLRNIDVHIRRIREKIEEKSKKSKYIYTKRGEGYFFKNKM